MNQKLYYIKEDIVSVLRDILAGIDAKHVFVVHGKGSYTACGAAAILQEASRGLTVSEFVDFSVNPKDEEAQQGVQQLLAAQPDLIIAVGGGSAMDMAKLIRHYAAEQGYQVPLVAIPTTAGTGAEATHFAVVYREGVKHSVEADDILPDTVVLYPPFTYSNSAYLTACTGFDALAQAIEAFWNHNATEESREYSERAMSLIYKQLPACIAHPEQTELRDELLQGAYWAGRAINITKTTAPHAFSYAFTSHYNYPHGHAVALTFPFFMQLNGSQKLFDLLDMSAGQVLQQTERYISSLGLSLQLPPEVAVRYALQAVNVQRLANNPVKVTPDITKELEAYLEKHQLAGDTMKEDFSKYNGEGTQLRKAQLKMLEILKTVDAICRKHHIDYWIDAGTLLGAVRHKGFIPWDDDIDISVKREDYKRMREIMQQELPENLVFVDWTTDKNYFDACGRVKMRNTYTEIPMYRYQKEQGLWVDIFPMETLSTYQEKVWGERIFGKVFRHAHNEGKAVKKSLLDYWITRLIALVLYPFAYLIISIFRWRGRRNSNLITYGFALCTVYPKHKAEWIFPTTDIEFEGIIVRAPHDFDKYLTEFYGDYMQVPPEEKRITHSTSWKEI